MFVGADRRAAAERLLGLFAEVRAGNGPRLAVLTGPIGWGKTRVVQEFYARLAAAQSPPGYWPARIVADAGGPGDDPNRLHRRRNENHPGPFRVPPGAAMEWMWWGLACHERRSGLLAQVLADDATQLFEHAEAMERSLSRRQRAAEKLAGLATSPKTALAVAGVLGCFPEGAAVGLAGAATERAVDLWKLGRELGEARRRKDRAAAGYRVDPEQAARTALVDELARSLARLSREAPGLPVVLVVDDAHWADPSLVGLLERLFERHPRAAVLVVATAWPDELRLQAPPHGTDPSSFGGWLTTVAPHRKAEVPLERLDDESLADVVRAVAPATTGATLDALVRHCDGNPLALELLLTLRPVRRSVADGAVTLAPASVAALPTGLEELHAARWDELPEPVRCALNVAALQGPQFVEACAAHAVAAAGLPDGARSLRRAVDPHAWVNALDADVRAFAERVQHDLARTKAVLTTEELDAARTATVGFVVARRREDRWSDLSPRARRRLLAAHVELAAADAGAGGGGEDLVEAAASAGALASLAHDDLDFAEAVHLGERAVRWHEAAGDAGDERALVGYRTDLAGSHGAVGNLGRALELRQRAAGDAERLLGAAHPDALATVGNLATSLHAAGDTGRALELLERAAADAERALGADHRTTVILTNNLAGVLAAGGPSARVLLLRQQGADRAARAFGPHSPERLLAVNNLARSHEDAGDPARAVELLEPLVDDCEEHLGPDHPATLTAKNNLANCRSAVGEPTRALELLADVAERCDRVHGPLHPNSLKAKANLASAHHESGDGGRALELREEVAAECEDVLGPDHPQTLTAGINLAASHAATGDPRRAFELRRRLARDCERVLGLDDPETLRAKQHLASSHEAAGDRSRALELVEQVLRGSERTFGPGHPNTSYAKDYLRRLHGAR